MTDQMTPIPFYELMDWILSDYAKDKTVFGVAQHYAAPPGKALSLFGERMETPFGPAAGPHTQLAQNILAAYAAGARFFELKTVQIVDGEELSKCVPKPCIYAEDEGYNCEWSTELTVEQALDEYVKAWFACKLLSHELALGDENGFVFNMSVGYDYAGITSPKIDRFIEGLKNAEDLPIFKECRDWALANLQLFEKVNARIIEGFSPRICTSITLSTLHGCPPQEIERIAAYLLETKKLHTFVKCNPTILGYASARKILDGMGYDYIAFDDHHFKEDLQFSDALDMFKRLQKLARKENLEFGLKLSNTFPNDVTRQELPSEEMYMSGRALFPLTIEMANRFTQAFDGRMRISFSGGADVFHIKALYNAGIWPITLATTLLKPGGYGRLSQIAQLFQNTDYKPYSGVSVSAVRSLAQLATQDPSLIKPLKPVPTKKIAKSLPLFSCFTAPCKSGCPIGQDIPEYVSLVGQGKHLDALQVITEKNPLPYITGRICPHHCADKCVRGYYEEPIRIRNAKLEAVRGGYEALIGEVKTPVMTSGKRAAIVGGGPGGLAAAYFLSRAGMPTTLFEKRVALGGIVRHVIPEFRMSGHGIDQDVQLIEKVGVRFKTGKEAPDVEALRAEGYDYILFATGAWAPGQLHLEKGEAMNVLEFLMACKEGRMESPVEAVCILGGGNTAMDAARAAKRLPGVKHVSIVYRRTKKYMPADLEELELALGDGVEFLELMAPTAFENGKLTCRKMRLGEPDASGRRSPVETDELVSIPCDTLVAAIGEGVEESIYTKNGIALTAKGRVAANPDTMETNLPGIYVLGDARRGPATVVEAIADAQSAAKHILGASPGLAAPEAKPFSPCCAPGECRGKVGSLHEYSNASRESERCLCCNVSCEICAQVCPNRANASIAVAGMEQRQILHIDRMCNECGNCAVFCPYDDGTPYLDKFTLFHDANAFAASKNQGALPLGGNRFMVRYDGRQYDIDLNGLETGLPAEVEAMLGALVEEYGYLI